MSNQVRKGCKSPRQPRKIPISVEVNTEKKRSKISKTEFVKSDPEIKSIGTSNLGHRKDLFLIYILFLILIRFIVKLQRKYKIKI